MVGCIAAAFLQLTPHPLHAHPQQSTVTVPFEESLDEFTIIDAADINQDGIDDILVGGMVDARSQVGYGCCDLPKELISKIRGFTPKLLVSGPSGYRVESFPEFTSTHRTDYGRLYEHQGRFYAYLGRNGEMGIPGNIRGEISVNIEIKHGADGISFGEPNFARIPTTTTHVSLMVLDGALHIVEGNFNRFSSRSIDKYASIIYRLGPNGELDYSNLSPVIEANKAHNSFFIQDVDGDGSLDLLAAGEVWRSTKDSTILSLSSGSYIQRNFLNSSERLLLPPAYGKEHAGWAVYGELRPDGQTILLETSSRFLGWQKGEGWSGATLSAYRLTDDFAEPLKVAGKITMPNPSTGRFESLSSGETSYILTNNYGKRPQMIRIAGTEIEVMSVPVRTYAPTNFGAAAKRISDGQCARIVSADRFVRNKNRIKVYISECIELP